MNDTIESGTTGNSQTGEKQEGKLRSIAIELIKSSPHQARETFDEQFLEGLSRSLKARGLLQPIVVQEIGDGFELVAGEQRLRAARLAGWAIIDALVVPKMTEMEAALAGMLENQQRRNLNPIEVARGYKRLTEFFNLSHAQLAEFLGVSKTAVTRSMSMLELPEDVQQRVARREITPRHIRAVEQVSSPEKRVSLLKQAAAEKLNSRQIKARAQQGTEQPQVIGDQPIAPEPAMTDDRVASNAQAAGPANGAPIPSSVELGVANHDMTPSREVAVLANGHAPAIIAEPGRADGQVTTYSLGLTAADGLKLASSGEQAVVDGPVPPSTAPTVANDHAPAEIAQLGMRDGSTTTASTMDPAVAIVQAPPSSAETLKAAGQRVVSIARRVMANGQSVIAKWSVRRQLVAMATAFLHHWAMPLLAKFIEGTIRLWVRLRPGSRMALTRYAKETLQSADSKETRRTPSPHRQAK
jgi:ParB family chromosome partitioning protein